MTLAIRAKPGNQTLLKTTNTPISVIIPVYKGGDKFQRCYLNAIAALSHEDELIIVIDGDRAGTPLPRETGQTRIYQTPERGGPAVARNLGATVAKHDILFFVDADVAIQPDALNQVKQTFARYPEISALIGSYDDEPSEKNFLSQYRNLLHHHVHQKGNPDAATFWGACGAIRSDVFHNIGGFDETLYDQPAIEDIELGYRLKAAGFHIRLEKQLQVKHLKHWSIVTLLKTDLFQRAIPWTELILHHKNLLNDLNTDTGNRISVLLTFLILILLPLATIQPVIFVILAGLTTALFWQNRDTYRFFYKKRGFWFTCRVIPWHWLYFLYSGIGFIGGSLKFIVSTNKKRQVTSVQHQIADPKP